MRHHGRPAGPAGPFRIGRHVHPKARAETAPPATPTGIDYLRLVEDHHTRSLGERLRYAHLSDPADPADPAAPAEPAEPAPPPPDDDGLRYAADLLTLAGADPAPGPAPEADLGSLAAPTRHVDPAGPAAAPAAAEQEETR